MALKKTKPQTGLSIARDGNKFTLSWKNPQKMSAQPIFGILDGDKNSFMALDGVLTNNETAKAITFDRTKFYPVTKEKAVAVIFMFTESYGLPANEYYPAGDVSQQFYIKVPAMPTLKATPSDSLDNVCTFTWAYTDNVKGAAMFTDVEYQSILVADSTETDGSKLPWKTTTAGWRTGTGAASSSITINESNSVIATGSHTRWVRVRSRGPAGASAWRYAKRVYAQPWAPKITGTKSTKIASGYQVVVDWTSAASYAYPVSENLLQYCAAIPGENLSVPDGASWTDSINVARTGAANKGLFIYDSALGEDEVLFTRVVAKHINSLTPSGGAVAQVGNLAQPEITNVVTDDDTYRATITATNNSEVPDSFLVVLYRTASKPNKTSIVGIIPHGETSTTVQVANWSRETGFAFGVYACVGSYSQTSTGTGVTSYKVTSKIRSIGEVWRGGAVPQAPSNVELARTTINGTIRVSWDWAWSEATSSIISWSDHPDAWESTDSPSEYEVTNIDRSAWNISGLETGRKWYVRVRLKKEEADAETLGPWSDIEEIDLSSAPTIPVLTLSESIISDDGSVTAYWAYVSTDGTSQAYAEICEATITSQGINYGRKIASTKTAQHITIYAEEVGWSVGETHNLCVRVVSGSGLTSEGWSAPVPIKIADPIVATITQSSLVTETIEEGGETREVTSLKSLPFTATIVGAGAGGTTTLIIERAEDYIIDRPEEEDFNGFQGETIALFTQTGESQISIEREALLGMLDDGAKYRLIGIVQDGLGQTDREEIDFEVHWTHQAVIPEATAVIQDGVSIISIIAPEGVEAGDYCNIYRLSADNPELIYSGAEFGERYVDPYPTIGEFGGHRICFFTSNGDYITEENELAWIDIREGDILDIRYGLINFDGDEIELYYDASQSNEWEKDFRETRYLGGSIQGDWNKGVSRSSNFDVSFVTLEDAESIRRMRRLAVYPGICQLRTLDGSNIACNIQVSESRDYGGDRIRASFSLSANKIDKQNLEGANYGDYFPEGSET